MKKHIIAGASVVVLMVIFCTAIASAGGEEAVVRELICRRTDTLSGFYAGEIDKKEAVETIQSIESGHLMEEDLQNIELYFQTDIEQVREYFITSIDIEEADEDIIYGYVTIKWKVEGIAGKEEFLYEYSIICSKEDNVYKLEQFF